MTQEVQLLYATFDFIATFEVFAKFKNNCTSLGPKDECKDNPACSIFLLNLQVLF